MTDETLFARAIAIPDPEARGAFLDRACPDPAQRARLDRLLAAHREDRFLEPPDSDGTRAAAQNAALTRSLVPDGRTDTFDPDRTAAHGVPSAAPVSVPGYELLGVLGEGGMGVVYRARQTAVDRVVALKMIRGGLGSAAERARFRAEAEAAAKLTHPGIARVYEFGEVAGTPYFTLEYCDGGSLAEKLDGTPWHPNAAARLSEMLADAVAAAHRQGIVHRDLKPANVLLARQDGPDGASISDPRGADLLYAALRAPHGTLPKVTDFGISKRLDSPDGPTATGAVMGTPSYMSPEQARGDSKTVGPAADVYALGAILYELLTGRPPFKAASVMETLDLVRAQEPVAVRALNPACPRDLETICLKCLQKEPAKRYSDATELADDLRRFQEGRPIAARPVGAVERGWRWCRRNPTVASLLAAVVLVLVTGITSSTIFALEARAEAAKAHKAKKESDDNADLASQNEASANAASARASANEASALAARDRTRRLLQSVRMSQVSDAFNDRKFDRVADALAEASPLPGEPDLRGWEWYCLDRLTRPDSIIPLPVYDFDSGRDPASKSYTVAARLSADGKQFVALRAELPITDRYRCEVWDLSVQPPRRVSSSEFRSRSSDQTEHWRFTPDLQHVACIETVREKNDGPFTAHQVSVFETRTGKAVPVPPLPYRDAPEVILTEVTAVAEGGSVVVIGIRAEERGVLEDGSAAPLTESHQNRFARWGRDTGKWTMWTVPDLPAGKDGKVPAASPLQFAVPDWQSQLIDIHRVLFRTDRRDRQGKIDLSRWQCWDFSTHPPRLVFAEEYPGTKPREMAVSANGEWVAVRSDEGLKVCRAKAELPVEWATPPRGFGGRDPKPVLLPSGPGEEMLPPELVTISNDGNRVLTTEDGIAANARVHTRFGPNDVRVHELLGRVSRRILIVKQFNGDGSRLLGIGPGGVHSWDLTREREMSLRLPPQAGPKSPSVNEYTVHPDAPFATTWVRAPNQPIQILARDVTTWDVKYQFAARAPGQAVALNYGNSPAGPRAVASFGRTPTAGASWQLLDPVRGFAEVASWTDNPRRPVRWQFNGPWRFDGPLLVGSFGEYIGQKRVKEVFYLRDATTGAARCEFEIPNSPSQAEPGAPEEPLTVPFAQSDPTGRYFSVRTWKGDLLKLHNAVNAPNGLPADINGLRVFDTATGKQLWFKATHTLDPPSGDPLYNASRPVFTPDGNHIVTAVFLGESEIRFQVFRCSDGEVIRRFRFSAASIHTEVKFSFSPDSRRMLYFDGNVGVLVDFETGNELFRFRGWDSAIRGVTFSSDGERLFLYEDGQSPPRGGQPSRRTSRLHVWDTRTGQRVLVLPDIYRPAPAGLPNLTTPEPIWFRDGKLHIATDGGVRVFDGTPSVGK